MKSLTPACASQAPPKRTAPSKTVSAVTTRQHQVFFRTISPSGERDQFKIWELQMKRCSSISVMRCSAIAKWMSVHNLLTLCARAVLGVSFALVRASLSSLLLVPLLSTRILGGVILLHVRRKSPFSILECEESTARYGRNSSNI